MHNLKIVKILKSKSGVSLILVLCVMVLLMGISGSVLFAASTASGSGVERQTYDRLSVFNDSLADTITRNIFRQDSAVASKKYLGENLLYDIGNFYNDNRDQSEVAPYESRELSLDSNFINNIVPEGISISKKPMLSFFDMNVDIIPFVPAISAEHDDEGKLISSGSPRLPQEARVSFAMKLAITTELKGKTLTSEATYNFTGGVLKDDGTNPRPLSIANKGKWKMTSYQKIDGIGEGDE